MTPNNPLDDRKRALEAYFDEKDRELIEQMRKKMEAQEREVELAAATGIADRVKLGELATVGLDSGSLAALGLVPLVEIAWADGSVADAERGAVLKAAVELGVAPTTSAYALLQKWLETRPDAGIKTAWREYVKALVKTLNLEQAQNLKYAVIHRARKVAESAGGFLGMGNKINPREEAMLDELASAFEG